MGGIGFVMKAAVGQGSAKTLVKEEKQQCDLDALGGEKVAVAAAVALQQAVTFQFAEIVTELVQAVGGCRELKAGQHGIVDLLGCPAADFGSASI